jgi:type I restriction enzyme R subunit
MQQQGTSACTYEEAEKPVSRLLDDFGPPSSKRYRAAMPFVHLESDVWELGGDDGEPLNDNRAALSRAHAFGRLRPEVEELLRRDPSLIAESARLLIDLNFTPTYIDPICADVGLDLEAAEETAWQHQKPARARRRPGFRSEVLHGWRNRCAMCGYVFDFCGNLEYFSQDLPGSEGSLQKSLNQRLFETRVGLVAKLDADLKSVPTEAPEGAGEHSEDGLRWDVARQLHATVAGMTLDNFLVRPHRQLVEEYALWPAWKKITPEAAEMVAENLAGLPSGHIDSDEDAKRFDLLILRRQLAQLQSDTTVMERIRETVQQIAAGLVGKNTIPSVVAEHELLEEVADDNWWIDATLPMLEIARRRLRGLLQFLDKVRKDPVYIDIQDELSEAVPIDLPAFAPGIDMDRFRAKAAAYLKAHEDHVALQRLRRNKALTPEDLLALEQMLLQSGAGDDKAIAKAKEDAHGLGLFIRSLVGLDRQAAMEAFGGFLDGTALGGNQIHFVNLIVDELTSNGVVEPARLYEPPYTDLTARGPEALFSAEQVDNIVSILDAVKQNATPGAGTGAA